MSAINNTTYYLLEKAFNAITTDLAAGLSWLDNTYLKADKLVKNADGKRYYLPAIYKGDNDYVSLIPDHFIGNYCFFTVDDPQEVETNNYKTTINATCNLIVWLDMRTAETGDVRNTEKVKRDILRILKDVRIAKGRLDVVKVYEKAENVFNEFSVDEIENQFLMSPFAGFRFVLRVEVSDYENCNN